MRPMHARMRAAGMTVTKGSPIAPVLDECLFNLQRNYRCEYVYKAAVGDRIVFGRHSPRTASLQVELPVGRSIVDLAVFNGTSTAYEIKTEFDSDKRLVSQTPDYLKAFDQVFVVTHADMAERCLSMVDTRVGILVLNDRGRLTTVRSAVSADDRIDSATLFRMLRRAEYQAAVGRLLGPQPDLPNGQVHAHYSRLWATLSPEQAHRAFVAAMRDRTTQPHWVDFLTALPASLRVLGYATPLSAVQRQRILNVLH